MNFIKSKIHIWYCRIVHAYFLFSFYLHENSVLTTQKYAEIYKTISTLAAFSKIEE